MYRTAAEGRGQAGGVTAVGGLAGTNIGDGAPTGAGLEDAMGSGNFDAEEADAEDNQPYAGASGGAVGGSSAGKRVHGGRARRGIALQPEPGDRQPDRRPTYLASCRSMYGRMPPCR